VISIYFLTLSSSYIVTLFIVIAASRSVNKNVSAGAVIRAKQGTEPGVRKRQANYQTGGYKLL